MAPRIDFELRSNAGLAFAAQFTDENELAHDFTGSTFKLQIKPAAGGVAVATLSSGSGIVHDDLEAGSITIEFPDGLAVGAYVYDLLRLTGGDPETLAFGEISVAQGVTAP